MTDWYKPKNNASSILAAAITADALTLTVAAGEGARFPSTYPFLITIDDEILKCTNRSTDTLIVERAQESTTAATHALGADVRLNITAATVTQLQTEIDGKQATLPLTTKGDLLAFAAALARLPVGTDGQYLVADSTQAAGIKWGTLTLGSVATKASGSYTGNDTANRAIPHGLGVIPILVLIWYRKATANYDTKIAILNPNIASIMAMRGEDASYFYADTIYTTTAMNSTNFYVGNAADYPKSMNGNALTYYWVAIG